MTTTTTITTTSTTTTSTTTTTAATTTNTTTLLPPLLRGAQALGGTTSTTVALSVVTSLQVQAASSSSASREGSAGSEETSTSTTYVLPTPDPEMKLYLPVASFQQLIGTDVANVAISGENTAELDAACHATCAENSACEFWVRHAGTNGMQYCWLKKEAVGSPIEDASMRGGYKATRITQPLDLRALRGKNLLIGGDSNDRNFVAKICEWMSLQGLHTELVHVTTLRTSEHSDSDFFLPRNAQPRICHVKSLDASIASAFHYGVGSIAPASHIHMQFMLDRPDHMPYNKVVQDSESEAARKPIFPGSDHVSKELWPNLVRDNLPPRPLHVVVQSSLWDSLPVILDVLEKQHSAASSIEGLQFARTFMVRYNWTEKASFFVTAVKSSLDAKQVIWRTTPGCPFGTPVSKISELQREAVIERITAGQSPWDGVQLLDWAASFRVKTGTDCDSESIRGVHYQPEGYWAYLEQLLATLSDKE